MTGLSAYTRTSVATASAPQIMVALFQAALANMRASAAAFEMGERKSGSVLAGKAVAIVLGLQGTLKDDSAPELCARLKELYTFVAWRLGVADVSFRLSMCARRSGCSPPSRTHLPRRRRARPGWRALPTGVERGGESDSSFSASTYAALWRRWRAAIVVARRRKRRRCRGSSRCSRGRWMRPKQRTPDS